MELEVNVLELDEENQHMKARVRHMNIYTYSGVHQFESEVRKSPSFCFGNNITYREAVGCTLNHMYTDNPSKLSLTATYSDYIDAYISGDKPDSAGNFNLPA